MEGSKECRAKIDRLVRKRAKFHLNDRVKVKRKLSYGYGLIGTIDSIGSITDIKNVDFTKVQYLVRMDATNFLYGYSEDELQLIVQSEMVMFT